MAVILISGGTGLIGRALSSILISKGHEVRVLSRSPQSNEKVKSYYWNVEKREIDERAFVGITHLVHLAGEGIADKRWTDKRKQEIIDSRVNSMKLIESFLLKNEIKLKSFVGASAIGFYGMLSSEAIYEERDKGTDDFLSYTCRLWEEAYSRSEEFSERTCIIRTGIVLSSKGGALGKMLPVFKWGIGSAIGSGKQYMPWIHINDVIRIYEEALFNPNFNTVFNAVSSQHINNIDFCKALAKAYHKPFFMPKVPPFLLKILYGEMADMLLTGSRISNQKLLSIGFSFQYTQLKDAFENIASQNK